MKTNVALMVFSSIISGAESVVHKMLTNISKDDFNVFLITNDEIKDKFVIDNVQVLSIGKLYDKRLFRRGLSKVIGEEKSTVFQMRGIVKKVQSLVKLYNIQIVHSNLLNDHYVNSRLHDVIRIMTIHGAHGLDSATGYTFSPDSIKKIYSSAGYIPSACTYFHGLLRNIGIDDNKFVIIPNGIDVKLIEEKKEDEIRDNNLNMVYLGGTRKVKGWDILLGGLKIVKDKGYTNFKLDILRDVPKDSELYKTAESYHLLDNIIFSGYVSNNDHLRHMARSNLYLLPSYSEGIANTLTEAIGLEKPVLATAVGGTPELIAHMKNGYLCETNAASVAEGILYFLENKAKLAEFAEYNKTLKSKYDWVNVIKEYELLYKKAIEE